MSRAVWTAALLVATALPGGAQEEMFSETSERARLMGVDEYRYTRDGKVVDILLLDSDGRPHAESVRLEFDTPEGLQIELRGSEKGPLAITWNPMAQNPEVKIVDRVRGVVVERRFDPASNAWRNDSGAMGDLDALLERRLRDFELTMVAADDALSNLGLYKYFSDPPRDESRGDGGRQQPPATEGACTQDGCEPTCSGPWRHGSSSALTASACCFNATNNVNNECTNGCCFGCCELNSCDVGCVVDDFFCVCGRDGHSCGPNPLGCEDWPPDCI